MSADSLRLAVMDVLRRPDEFPIEFRAWLARFPNESGPVPRHTHDDLYAALGHDHDADYAPLAHTHDDRYFTESEVTALLDALAATIPQIEIETVTVDIPSTTNHSGNALDVTLTSGALVGDQITILGWNVTGTGHRSMHFHVRTPIVTENSARVDYYNPHSATIDPASADVTFLIIHA